MSKALIRDALSIQIKNPIKSINFPIILLLWAITAATFFPSLFNQFTSWDDYEHLTENHLVDKLDLAHIKAIFTSKVNKTYIPLTTLSFAVEVHFFGKNPFVFHLNNLLLHLLIVSMVFVIGLKMGLESQAAFWAALLFAIHPMHVESVAWITQRKDMLYGVFYLLAILCYLNYLSERKLVFYASSSIFGLLSILSKSMALSLPLALIAIDIFYNRRDIQRIVLEKIPYFTYIIPITALTFFGNEDTFVAIHQSLSQGVLIFIWTVTFYIQKFVWPSFLSPIYEIPQPIHILTPDYFLSMATLGVCLYVIIRFRKNRWVIFSFLFYLVSLFFLFRISYVTDRGMVADRFMYLPSLGFCYLIGDSLVRNILRHPKHQKIIYGVLILIFLVLGAKTFNLCKVWKDSFVFWNFAITHTKRLAFPYNNRGNIYLDEQKYDRAVSDYQKALKLDPAYPEPYNNLGIIYNKQGRYDLARASFNNALTLKPNYSQAYFNRAMLHQALKDFPAALADLTEAVAINPALFQAYNNRGIIYLNGQRYDLALADFTRALTINSQYIDSYNNRGLVHLLTQNYDSALNNFDQILKINAHHFLGYHGRGLVYYHLKKMVEAIVEFDKAIMFKPQYGQSYYWRSMTYFMLGQFPKAWDDLQKAQGLGYRGEESYTQNLKTRMESR